LKEIDFRRLVPIKNLEKEWIKDTIKQAKRIE